MKKVMLAILLAAVCGIPAFAQGSTWQIDPAHANAQFSVRHLGISNVQGEFTNVTGTVQLDEQDITKSSVNATIDMNSVNTRNDNRDKDLKSSGFFDTAKYPTMTFQSTKITRQGDGRLQMTGNLTLHGVTKEVSFDVQGPTESIKDPWNNNRRGASATAKIKRADFGVTKDAGLVGDDIAITLDVEMVKK
jgi:polyisoprenoid-binding protein YceI